MPAFIFHNTCRSGVQRMLRAWMDGWYDWYTIVGGGWTGDKVAKY